jgi:hypothetical protein
MSEPGDLLKFPEWHDVQMKGRIAMTELGEERSKTALAQLAGAVRSGDEYRIEIWLLEVVSSAVDDVRVKDIAKAIADGTLMARSTSEPRP